MNDPALPPADVLAVFLEIKRFVDSTVSALQEAASPVRQVVASDSATATETESVSVVAVASLTLSASVEAVVIPAQTPTFTIDQVNMAQAWVEMAKSAGRTIVALGALESLLQFAQRVLDLTK